MSKKQEIKTILFALAGMTAGAVLTSMAVNAAMSSSDPKLRSGVQIGAGALPLIFFGPKHPLIRYALMGSAVAGTMGMLQNTTKMKALAGNSGTLSPAEIRQLQMLGAMPSQMGQPRTMGQPATMGGAGFRPGT